MANEHRLWPSMMTTANASAVRSPNIEPKVLLDDLINLAKYLAEEKRIDPTVFCLKDGVPFADSDQLIWHLWGARDKQFPVELQMKPGALDTFIATKQGQKWLSERGLSESGPPHAQARDESKPEQDVTASVVEIETLKATLAVESAPSPEPAVPPCPPPPLAPGETPAEAEKSKEPAENEHAPADEVVLGHQSADEDGGKEISATPQKSTVAAEGRCRQWLETLMQAGAPQKAKACYRDEAISLHGVSVRAFGRAWGSAAANVGELSLPWTKPGRKS